MVGSRLYFKVNDEVLQDDARFESVMDDIVLEVRRRAPDTVATDHRTTSAEALATASLPPPPRPQPQHSAPMAVARRAAQPSADVVGQPAIGGSSVMLTVHSNSNIRSSNNNNVSNCCNNENCGNTSTNTNTSTSTLVLL